MLATVSAGHQMWGSDANGMLSNSNSSGHIVVAKSEPLILDDFAIYQVDKADLIQGEWILSVFTNTTVHRVVILSPWILEQYI